MILDLQLEPGEDLEIRINGKVIIESLGGEGLMLVNPTELRVARVHRAIPQIIINALTTIGRIERAPEDGRTPKQKREAFGRGLLDGWEGRKDEHPAQLLPGSASVPDILPEAGLCYTSGYELGASLIRAAKATEIKEP